MSTPDLPHLRHAGVVAGRLLERTDAEEVRIVRSDLQQRVFFVLDHSDREPVTLAVAYEPLAGDEDGTLEGHLAQSLPFGGGWR